MMMKTTEQRISFGKIDLNTVTDDHTCVVITDTEVGTLYAPLLTNHDVITIGRGEEIKTPETLMTVIRELTARELDRSGLIIGFGGGIVTDITGLAATVFKRGVSFGFVPSTLLAMVDAAVGGKNGVNVAGYKNIMGTFNEPNFIHIDPDLLDTLPDREYACGLAETVKHAVIADKTLFHFLEDNTDSLRKREKQTLTEMIQRSIAVKNTIVEQDFRESSRRKLLNFGHTFAHALEFVSSSILHGEAVAAGMLLATDISEREHRCPQGTLDRLTAMLENLGVGIPPSGPVHLLLDAMRQDKKRRGTTLDMILLSGDIGSAEIVPLPYETMKRICDDLCEYR